MNSTPLDLSGFAAEPGTGDMNVAPGFSPGSSADLTLGAAGPSAASAEGPSGDIPVLDLRLPRRTDASYEIEAISKGLAIMEILVEERSVTEKQIVAKSEQTKDVVLRTMRTLRLRGYAVRDDKTLQWRPGPRLKRLAEDVR